MLATIFSPSQASSIPLVSFDPSAPKELQHSWKALNDPVMGGRSTSTVVIDNAVLNFTGTCAIVPSLNAPGFITAATGHSMFSHETFVDVSSCTGLEVMAGDFSGIPGGYQVIPCHLPHQSVHHDPV